MGKFFKTAEQKPTRGIYIVEPHAKWLATKDKMILLKSRRYHIEDEPLYLLGKKNYGVIKFDKPFEMPLSEFDKYAPQHKVDRAEHEKWWRDYDKLYAYPIKEVHIYKTPKDYEYKRGAQTFIKMAEKKKPDLAGLYLYQDQGRFINNGEMPVIVKARKFTNMMNKPFYLLSKDKAYGIISMDKNIQVPADEVVNSGKYHWHQENEWRGLPYEHLYRIPYTYVPFKHPLKYTYRPGVRSFDSHPEISFNKQENISELLKKWEEKHNG